MQGIGDVLARASALPKSVIFNVGPHPGFKSRRRCQASYPDRRLRCDRPTDVAEVACTVSVPHAASSTAAHYADAGTLNVLGSRLASDLRLVKRQWGRQHALLAPRAPLAPLAPLSSLLGLKSAVGRRQPALPAPPSSRLALKGQRPPRLKGAGGGRQPALPAPHAGAGGGRQPLGPKGQRPPRLKGAGGGRQPALLAPPAGAEVSPTGFRHRSETATHPPSSFDIVPDPTLAITVSVVKLEPRWRLIYVGGDDDTDAGARTRDHAHTDADAVDDAGADARQRRSVTYMPLLGREQSASKMVVQFIARKSKSNGSTGRVREDQHGGTTWQQH